MTATSSIVIPFLENGDRLTRDEFERRYTAMPTQKNGNNKAELIEGVVHMASPLRVRGHGQPHGDIIGWLWTYKIANPNIMIADNATVRLDINNEPQPDVVMFIPNKSASITEDDYIAGAPELIVEIAASSVSIDLYDKKEAYCRNGVQEYIVWRTLERAIDWFTLENGEYVKLKPDNEGIIKSQVFLGLWLPVEAMLSGEMREVISVLKAGLDDCKTS